VATGFVDALVTERVGRPVMNEGAFLDFYARTAGPLTGYLRRLTGSATLAEDLMQESYLRFLGLVRVPETDDHRRHYLFRIATNLARDHYRREWRYEELPEPSKVADVARQPDVGRSDIWHVLGALSPRDRELLLLAYVEGMTHREIAGVTGLMRASIKPLLFRARGRFSAALRTAGLAGEAGVEASS
jgi:RNA polymerase sigma-70 factor (ECF subfamily)